MNLREQIEGLTDKTEFTADDRKVFEDFKAVLQKGGPQNIKSFPDLVSFALHYLVAQRLRLNPQLIQKAKSNLNNWLSKNPTVSAWLEWRQILENESLEGILEIITAESDEGQRLRSSSPFAGLVSKQERKTIIELCEKARPV